MAETLLSVTHLSVSFRRSEGMFRRHAVPAIRDISLHVDAGEVVAVIGASGSGKSVLAHAVLGILPGNAQVDGDILYRGEALLPRRVRALRGQEIVLVPQGVSFLDPLMRVGPQVRNGDDRQKTKAREHALYSRYGLATSVAKQYPHALSGGMARRVLLATAAMRSPRLVVADEPTPGLHASLAKEALAQFRQLADGGAGVLLITHDLQNALPVADRVVVLYAGMEVEEALAADFGQAGRLRHPYTRALWAALPAGGLHPLPGHQPAPGSVGEGCAFAPRCGECSSHCQKVLAMFPARGGRVRCALYGEGGAPC